MSIAHVLVPWLVGKVLFHLSQEHYMGLQHTDREQVTQNHIWNHHLDSNYSTHLNQSLLTAIHFAKIPNPRPWPNVKPVVGTQAGHVGHVGRSPDLNDLAIYLGHHWYNLDGGYIIWQQQMLQPWWLKTNVEFRQWKLKTL